MIDANPFATVAELLSPLVLKIYIVLMVLAVVIGTLFDVSHKGSARFFAQRREKARASARTALSGAATAPLLLRTIAEAAVSGEFCKWPRRASHLLMMYGFFLHCVTTVLLVFVYPGGSELAFVPLLWSVGAFMVVVGGLWFFFFLRVNVAHDGASPFYLGRADLFVGSLVAAMAFALLWQFAQLASAATGALILFALYIFFATLLFVSVPWSKFSHMFFKPAVAFQRRVEEANGSSDLPRPTTENFIARS